MLRKEVRRRLRRREIRTRLVAGVTAIAIGLGLAVGGTAAATANPNATLSTPVVNSGGVVTYDQNGLTCNSSLINFQKPSALDSLGSADGSYTAAWGSISWDASERTVTWSITPGWDVDVCVKGGTYLSTIDTSTASGSSYTHTYAGLSHLGFRVNAAQPTNDLTCDVATNYTGRALTNGDHINMDIVQNGQKFQVNAQIDIRQAQDPVSESGLVVRVNAPGGPYTLPLTNAQRDSGVFAFTYSTYLSDAFTVEWVQFNSTYFNQNRDQTRFLVCGDLPTEELVTPTARMVDLTCDAAGSYTLDAVEGIRWFIGSTEVQPGTYAVGTAGTVVVRAEAISPDYGLESGAQSEFTFVFTEPDAGCAAVDVNLTLTYMEECAPDSTYTFRVRNAQTFSVPYTFTVAGNPALNGSGIAAPGDSFFDLDLPRTNPAQSYTVTLKWGDGTTILAEQTTKASGRDKVCELTVEPVVDIACATPGSYTVPSVLGVSWSIAGLPVEPGTYTVEDPSTLTLRATATSGHVLYLNGQLSTTRDFTLTFTEPGPCADPTFDGRTVTTSECDNDTPWIDYSVIVNDPDGQLSGTRATLTFVHPTDPTQNHVVELGDVTAGEALAGRILWPGASVDPVTGEPTGWPGWAFEGGEWVVTDGNFAWTRDLTEVTLTVNPSMQIAIAYPPATPECVAGPVELEPIPVKETCLTDGQAAYDLPAITGVTWFVNGQQRDAGTYPVLAAETVEITFTIDPAAAGGPYALKPGADESFTFAFTAGDLCDLPELPVTNASIAFLEPTCDFGQQLDPANFVVEDAELARYAPELSDLEGPSYSVVFVITDDDAVFFDSSEPVPGRTVSDGGKTLTFTGTLLGPDRSEECVTVVELRDPVSYVDTCFEQSFTITRVVGIVYTVYINDETPFVVEWVGDETTRTYAVEEGDSVRVVPSPASDRYTISPEPAPFERTFAVYPFECLETSPLTTASASFTPATCSDMTNWVTLQEADGVQWWVNGERAEAGTWPATTGETVVTVTPLPGFGFPAEQPTRWEFEGVDPSAECLELASTGVGQGALAAGIAGLVMLLLGAGILGYRRQRA